MSERSDLEMSSVETQLLSLYTDREVLERELGTSDPERLVQIVRELEDRAARLESASPALPSASSEAVTSPGALMATDGGPWGRVLARVGGTSAEEVAAYIDELEVRLVAAEACLAKREQLAQDARAVQPREPANAAAQPLGEVVGALRALASDLGSAFDRAELCFEGELPGARWSVRCSNGGDAAH